MTFRDCVESAIDEGSVGRQFGKAAQQRWDDLTRMAEAQGMPRHIAEQAAARQVKQELHAAKAAKRHETQARMAMMQRAHVEITQGPPHPDSATRMQRVDFQVRGLERAAWGRMGQFLYQTRTDILSRSRDPVLQQSVLKAIFGEATDDAAKAMAGAIADMLEWLRLMANEAGANIGKLDGYFPVTHNRRQVVKAGFDAWFSAIDGRLDWARMRDPATGKPFGSLPREPFRRDFIKAAHDNIVFGAGSREAIFGRPEGEAAHRRLSHGRVFHWKSADDWIAYNREFGSGDPMRTLHDHVRSMARDITTMREFGPTPRLGLQYRAQVWAMRAREAGDPALLSRAKADLARADKMMKVLNGPGVPNAKWEEWSATFFATARQFISGARLERASLMALSDLASTRSAAKMVGMNVGNVMRKFVGEMRSLSREELIEFQWIAETWAAPDATQARFSDEMGAQTWAQRFNNASMRLQGLAAWSDRLRGISYQEFAGFLGRHAGKAWGDLPEGMRRHLAQHQIAAPDWDAFRSDPDGMFTAPNGAKFLAPIYWRAGTQKDATQADDLFMRFQGAAEQFLELAVPSRSLWADSFVAPEAYGMTPGSIPFELLKSGGMFKRFILAMTTNMAYQ